MNKYILLCASLVLLNPCFAEDCNIETIDNPAPKKNESSQTKPKQKVRKKRFVSRNNKQQPVKPAPKVEAKKEPVKPVKPTPKVRAKKEPVKPTPVKPVRPAPKVLPKAPKNQVQVKKKPATPKKPEVVVEAKKEPVIPKVETKKEPVVIPKKPEVVVEAKKEPVVTPKKPEVVVEAKKEPVVTPKKPEVVVEVKKDPIIGFEGLLEAEAKPENIVEAELYFPIEGSKPKSEPLNKKETSPSYDRNINSETHHSVSADTTQNSNQKSKGQSTEPNNIKPIPSEKCSTPFHQGHISVRHSEAEGVGYDNGYTTLEAFGLWDGCTSFMPFIDLRGHVFDDGKFAGNAGLGGRTFISSMNQVLGYYVYYDVRQENHGLTAQQLSPGIEVLGKRMEYRINGYFPIGDQKSHQYHAEFDRFDDHHIMIKTKQKRLMTGGDAEVGVHLTQSTKIDLYAGAGPYYFTSSHTSAWGGKARLLGRFKEYISLEATYTYDHLFGSIIQGSVGFNLPLGGKIKRKGKNCSSQVNLALSRAAFSPYRFEIPVVKKVTRRSKAINPATDAPWFVWFVDNTSSSDGTFASPFPTLAQAQNASGPNDMIYVFPGDGTTTGMNAGITLQNGQTLFGSGISQRFKTSHGMVKIPAFSNSFPLITNTGGDVVTLANSNQVSGLSINPALANTNGIAGGVVNGAMIENNRIFGSIDFGGVFIANGSGNVAIKNNQIINSLTPSSSANAGINISVQDGNFTKANISNNFFSGFIDGLVLGIPTHSTTASADIAIENNTILNFYHSGILYITGIPNSTVSMIGNTINNTVGIGAGATGSICVSVNNADSGTVFIQNNTITTTTPNNGVNSIFTTVSTGALKTHINDNRVATGAGAGSVGINVAAGNNSSICTEITGNAVMNQGAGNDFQISTGATTGVINIDNDFSGNVGSNISITGNVNFVPEGSCD